MSLTSPLGRVLGLGSAKEGSRHWYAQRLSSVAVAALAKFGRGGAATERLVVPDDLVPLVVAHAATTGVEPEAALRALLEASLAGPPDRG